MSAPATCATCGIELSRQNRSGYCKHHVSAAKAQDPAWREAQRAGARRKLIEDPIYRERIRQAARRNQASEKARIARTEAAKQQRNWAKAIAASHTPQAEARRAQTVRAKAFGWCPPHLREAYRHLVKVKRIPAAEAREIILAQEQAEIAAMRRRLEWAA